MTVIVTVAVLGFAGGLLYVIGRGVVEEPSLVGSLATALAAVLAVVIGREREKRLDLRQRHRDQIGPIYEELVGRVREFGEDDQDSAASEEFFKSLQTKLVLYAPPPVIKAWLEWSRTAAEAAEVADDEPINIPMFAAWERLLLAIRDDLGHKDGALDFWDVQRIYINDLDEALKREAG
ncbi:MAG: hypothetical protein QOJ97_2303 [Solirubrobacteraceae bacterium]|jgi:hypothetical protein|nr:hypothetical protein [Solirubrobacteraceae bacterium]